MTTTITTPTTIATIDPVAAATELAPALRARAAEAESRRTLPADLVEQAQHLGLTVLLLPRSLGGREADPMAVMTTIETLAEADGSAGWSLMISNATFFLAWLEPDDAAALLPGRPFSAAGMFGPLGRGVPVDGGLRVTGQWPFCSASPHAELYMNGLFVHDGDTPRFTAAGQPDWRFAVLSRQDVDVLDNWDALGLRGSGSHDVRTDGTFVPDAHLFFPFDTPARHGGPLWRFSFWGLLTVLMAPLPLGIARHALDALAEMAPMKRRGLSPDVIGSRSELQIEVARAEARVLAARSLLFDSVGDAWDTACNGDAPTPAQLARMQLAMLEGMDAGTRAADVAFRAAGAGAVYSDSPIGRCFRDIHTAGQHLAFSQEGLRNYGRARLLGSGA